MFFNKYSINFFWLMIIIFIVSLGFYKINLNQNSKIEMVIPLDQTINPVTIELDENKPQIRMKKWDGEVNMGATFQGEKVGKLQMLNDDIAGYHGENQTIRIYSLVNGNLEIEVILNEKPKSNIISFVLDNYENLDFFYQSPLTAEFKNGYSEEFGKEIIVTETEVKDLNGNVLVERPENVIHSYAVYYKDHQNYIIGQKNYETGKAYHIYRPIIDDSAGNKTFGKLNIEGNKLTVTIPPEFLEKAVYPIYHASGLEFGYSTIGETQVNSGSTPSGSRYQAPTESGTITKLTHYGAGGTSLIAAVYSDNSDDINALLSQNIGVVTSATPNGWWDVDITDYVFTPSAYYWLVSWGGTSNYNYFYDAGATNQYRAKTTGLSWPTWPDPFDDNFTANRKKSIYATYELIAEGGSSVATSSVEVKGGTKIKGGVKFK